MGKVIVSVCVSPHLGNHPLVPCLFRGVPQCLVQCPFLGRYPSPRRGGGGGLPLSQVGGTQSGLERVPPTITGWGTPLASTGWDTPWQGQDGVPSQPGQDEVPPGQDRLRYPPPSPPIRTGWGTLLIPPGQDRLEYPSPPPPPPRPRDRTAQRVFSARWPICLLRSRRRTILYI